MVVLVVFRYRYTARAAGLTRVLECGAKIQLENLSFPHILSRRFVERENIHCHPLCHHFSCHPTVIVFDTF